VPGSWAISRAFSIIRGIRSGVILPPWLGTSVKWAPKASIVRSFSRAKASEETTRKA